MPAQALYCRRGPPHKTPAFMCNVQNILLVFQNLVCSWTVQLALGIYCSYAGVPQRQYTACAVQMPLHHLASI